MILKGCLLSPSGPEILRTDTLSFCKDINAINAKTVQFFLFIGGTSVCSGAFSSSFVDQFRGTSLIVINPGADRVEFSGKLHDVQRHVNSVEINDVVSTSPSTGL